MRHITAAILILTTTTGCALFSRDDAPTAATGPVELPSLIPTSRATTQIVDSRALVETVSSLRVQEVAGGTLITATGRTGQSDGFNVALTPNVLEGSTLTLDFRVQYPVAQIGGPGQPVTAAYFVPNKDMRGVQRITVQAANGSLSRRN